MKTACDILKLEAEIQQLAYTLDDSGAEMAFMPSSGIPKSLAPCPEIMRAISEIVKERNTLALNVMINKLPPNTIVPAHRDWLKPTQYQAVAPTVERWHLPIMTSSLATWWDEESGTKHMQRGFWYGPIPYWILHSVANRDCLDTRVHLVVDLDTKKPIGMYK